MRLDAMLDSIWGVAMEDPQVIEQWVDKKRTIPDLDEEGRQYVYVVPSYAKLDAISKVLKLMERRARYLGLDHADNIAERQVAINEKMGQMLAQALPALIENPWADERSAGQGP